MGLYYPRFEEKLYELDQILFLVERIKSTNYGVRVDVIECIFIVQKKCIPYRAWTFPAER